MEPNALGAQIGIDDIQILRCRNGFVGAFWLAGAAVDAIVGDDGCHGDRSLVKDTLLFRRCQTKQVFCLPDGRYCVIQKAPVAFAVFCVRAMALAETWWRYFHCI